jgi:hypothetical protein
MILLTTGGLDRQGVNCQGQPGGTVLAFGRELVEPVFAFPIAGNDGQVLIQDDDAGPCGWGVSRVPLEEHSPAQRLGQMRDEPTD